MRPALSTPWWKKHSALPLLLGAALLLTLLMEMLGHHSFVGGLLFALEQPGYFLFNLLIVFTSLTLSLLFSKQRAVSVLLGVLWLGLGIANGVTLAYRGSPLVAFDFALLRSTWSVLYSYLPAGLLLLVLLALALVIGGMVLLFRKTPARKPRYLPAVGTLLLSAALLGGSLSWGLSQGALPREFEDMTASFQRYGFAYSFLYSALDRGVDLPVLEDPHRTVEILQDISSGESTPAERTPNIVFLQLESFMDVSRLRHIRPSQDPTPTMTALKGQYPHGYLTVPSLGGGTANTEFEVLTGMNLRYFGTGEYPYDTILRSTACESVSYNLRRLGYACHAIHNHNGTFYSRDQVYSHLGFDSFTSVEYMQDVQRNAKDWAKDQVLVPEILKALNSTHGQDLVYAISVQGHGKYPSEQIDPDQSITISGASSAAATAQWEYYVNQLWEMDQSISQLLQELAAWEEPTVLVLFGDHLPALYIEDIHLAQGSRYQTEYVLWSNFDLNARDRDLFAYELTAYVQQCLGMEEGLFTKLHQRYSGDPLYQQLLNLLEYDVLYGDLTIYGGEVPYAPTELEMGSVPIRVTGTSLSGEGLYIYGENFTPYSIAALDDWWLDTTFVDSRTLFVTDLTRGSGLLTILQVGSDGQTLSSSEGFPLQPEHEA